MGGAIVINALKNHISGVRGSILVAPAVWARQTMPWYQTSLLWLLAHTMPGLTLTGESVGVTPSDNIDMLRELGRDPFVIKATRVGTVNGLTDLMDAAYESADTLAVKSLILYGDKDEIIPKEPTYQFLRNLTSKEGDNKTIAFYPNGYHMLLRDLKAEIALNDIVAWIKAGAARLQLPSGADKHASEQLRVGS